MPVAGWHPVALGVDIEPGTAVGTRLFGQDLAVWRDGRHAVHVWEDRCPHRGMRLSFGFVRGERLSCLYHGWQFDGDGRCRSIPAHPALEVPASITVARHVAAEQNGIVWVSFGADAPMSPPSASAETLRPVRSLSVTAPADVLVAMMAGDAASAGPLDMCALSVGPDRVVVAIQPLAERETCLHLLVDAAEGAIAEAQLRVSTWAEGLRRRAEAAA